MLVNHVGEEQSVGEPVVLKMQTLLGSHVFVGTRAFEDIFLMITLWGYDLVNPALWEDVGVLNIAPSIIVPSILGFDRDTPLSINQDVKLDLHRFVPASRDFGKIRLARTFVRDRKSTRLNSSH